MDSKSKVVEYFKKNLRKGYTEDSLKFALINQGYSRSLIEGGLEQLHRDLARQAPILRDTPKIEHELINEYNLPVETRKPWWKRLFGL